MKDIDALDISLRISYPIVFKRILDGGQSMNYPYGAFPGRLYTVGNRYLLEWFQSDTANDSDEIPFFNELRNQKQCVEMGGRWFTSVSTLDTIPSFSSALKPSLFIYHATRCGSTLMGRMIWANAENRVFNEPGSVTELLMAMKAEDRVDLHHLRNLIGAYGLNAPWPQKNLVFKFASLCNFFIDDIHEAFPLVPSVFVYRDPVEILVALTAEPANWLYDIHYNKLRGILPWSEEQATSMAIEQLACLYLERQFQWALDRAGIFERLVNYSEMPEAAYDVSTRFLGSDIRAKSPGILAWNSKKPDQPFTPDSHKKQAMATPLIRSLAEARLYPLYLDLEAKRKDALARLKPAEPWPRPDSSPSARK